ncbi:MAG: DUF2520 domain-containing protein [Gammaproteobacteria bacterium]|nr:DUF2520 domain-containing protein [Gammaproteobacteria bacterium]
MLTVNIIGAGAVGQTLGHLLAQQGVAKILGVVNQHIATAEIATQFMGQGQAYASIDALPHADITMVTTPDNRISDVAIQLLQNSNLQPDAIVLHCSGPRSSDDLAGLHERGILVASIHPMMSFVRPQISVAQFANTLCALEGDPNAVETITALFTAIGAVVYPIKKDKKALYHAAAVFASNYQITMAQHAFDCFIEAGVPGQRAQALVTTLMQTVVHNMAHVAEPKKALTGPLQRGDSTAVQAHLHALSDPDAQALYRKVGQATLPLTNLETTLRDVLFNILTADAK